MVKAILGYVVKACLMALAVSGLLLRSPRISPLPPGPRGSGTSHRSLQNKAHPNPPASGTASFD